MLSHYFNDLHYFKYSIYTKHTDIDAAVLRFKVF